MSPQSAASTAVHALLGARDLPRDDKSNHTCPSVNTSGPPIEPLFGSITFHTFATILSGACLALTAVIAFFHIMRHATHYSCPTQQRQVIRIICLVPWVSAVSFLSVLAESAGEYIAPAIDVGSALALSSFLLLLCDFVLAEPDGFDELFGDGAMAKGVFASTSPQWLKRTWYSVLQFIPVSVLLWIVTAGSLAASTYCAASSKLYFAHIWVSVIKSICTAVAVTSILRFVQRFKSKLAPHRAFPKLLAFKGVIFVNVFQTFIIGLLVSKSVIKPTSHLSYNDLSVGLPNLILACEMPLFAGLVFWAFDLAPYQRKARQANHGGPAGLKAILHALDQRDLLGSLVRGPMRLVRMQSSDAVRHDSVRLMDSPPAYPPPPNAGVPSGPYATVPAHYEGA